MRSAVRIALPALGGFLHVPKGTHDASLTIPTTVSIGAAIADLLRTIAAGTANAVGQPFFEELTRQLARAFQAELAYVAESLTERPAHMRVLASSAGGVDLPEGAEIEVAGNPCGLASRLVVPMNSADGSVVGQIGVCSARPIEATAEDRAALEIFASRAAAEVERRRQEDELRARDDEIAASRMRIVQAAEDERRRIGANLHDGAQQRLVAIGHFLDVARKKMGDAAPDAAPLVERARDEARDAGRELRELSRGLNPASLTERGLGVALETLAGNCPLPVRLLTVPEGRLPDPIETALYYLVSEALANAARHANASQVTVSIVEQAGAIVAEVWDDGSGSASPGSGTGLQTLNDRVSALGGSLSVTSPDGAGTLLRASIPEDPWRRTDRAAF
jgi:signal transduction histidine kinase